MAQNPLGTLSPEEAIEQQRISRQQQMANLLMQQGMQAPQGQMISGRYVAPSIFQNLAGLANVYVGRKLGEEAEQKQLDLAQKLREGREVETKAIMDKLRGTPEQVTEMAGPYTGNIPAPVLVKPAVSPDIQGAMDLAMRSRYGAGQALLPTLIQRSLPEPIKPTTDMQNYEFAKSTGFKGSFNDFKNQITPYQQANINLEREKFEFEKNKISNKGLPEGLNKQVTGSINLTDAISDYQKKLSNYGLSDFANPNKRAEMGNAYNNMMLQAKEAYNLGVLNGPDYDILQRVVKDPTKLSSLAFSNDALSQQADSLRTTAAGIVKNAYMSQNREVPADIAAKFAKPEIAKKEEKPKPPKATGAMARAMLNGRSIVVRDGKWVDEQTGNPVQ